jgi:uncharacterized protein YbaR (Trm112 family)
LKPWLINILACPIDKYHPLEAYFFKWETTEEELEKITGDAGKPSQFFKKQYIHLVKQIEDGTISASSLKSISDHTGSAYTSRLQAIVNQVILTLENEQDLSERNLINKYPEDVDILYRYLNLIEVEEGLLRCPECSRWYPIGNSVETIPELMPDDLRQEEKELTWLRKWIDLVPISVRDDGKPFKP